MPTWNDIAYKYIPNHDHTAEAAGHLVAGNTVVIPDPDGDLIPFFVRKDSLSAGAKGKIKLVECDHLYYELADGPIRSYNLTNAIPATAIAVALEGTRWSLGNIAPNLAALVKDFRAIHVNPLEFLRLIEKEFEARLKFRAEVEGAGITAYKVDLLEIEQVFSGKRFEFGRDLQDITIAVDCSDIKTALFGYSLSEEIDPATGEPLPMTFRDVEWRRSKGDPADKPLGQDWVGNETARELYGICDPATGKMLHRFGKYESQAETPEGLLQATWLIGTRYHFRPRVTVEGNVADLEQAKIIDIKTGELVQLEHEKVRLGQITYVVARDKGLLAAVDVRVTRIERYLKEPWRTRIVFGDPIPLDSDYIAEIKRMAAWRDKRRRMLDRGRGGQTVTVASEETSRPGLWEYATYIVPKGELAGQTIQAAVDDCHARGGGRVVCLEGTYKIQDYGVMLRSGVILEGQGPSTVFQATEGNAYSMVYVYFEDTIYDMENQENIGIKNLCFHNPHNNAHSSEFVHVACSMSEFAGLTLKCNPGNIVTGLNIMGSHNIIRDIIGDQLHTAIYISGQGNVVTGCSANECTRGIVIKMSSECAISNNNVRGFTACGIHLDDSSRNNISDNVCIGGDSDDHEGAGIWLYNDPYIGKGSHDNSVQNNICSGAYYGITIFSGCNNNKVSNNDLRGNEAGLNDMGTGTITSSNNIT